MKLFGMIMSQIGPAIQQAGAIKQLEDALLDTVEELVAKTDNDIDDQLVLPVVKGIRVIMNIPDHDQEDENA